MLVFFLAASLSVAEYNWVPNCVRGTESRFIRGTSLTGIIEHGQPIQILFGYYSCNPVRAGDMVVYSYAGHSAPLLKVVHGMPGDRIELQRQTDGWRLIINGEQARTSLNEPYFLDSHAHAILALYIRDYKGIIPNDSYLILGNLSEGTLDSTRFGLIHKNDLMGRAVIKL